MRYLHLRTERLCLDAVTHHDLDQVHELRADPEVWRHLPSGRLCRAPGRGVEPVLPPHPGNPDRTAIRLIYADRPLTNELIMILAGQQ
jgi:hypothetical protein